jgi:hypothetical protein
MDRLSKPGEKARTIAKYLKEPSYLYNVVELVGKNCSRVLALTGPHLL